MTIESITVDADDIIAAFERNRRDETEQRTHVLRITPPLDGEVKADLFVSEDYNYYPPEMDPKPIHLSPKLFVGDDTTQLESYHRYPSYSEERGLFLSENGYVDEETGERLEWTDEMETEFEEWWDVTTGVWEDSVRNALRDDVVLRNRTQDGWDKTTIEVNYEDNK